MDELFEALREECEPAVWSRAVELARRNAVSVETRSEDELVLRVLVRSGRAAPAVRLSPRRRDWECDCDSPDDPCEHVAAAAIALRRERDSGQALPAAGSSAPKLGYRLSRARGGVAVARVLVRDGVEQPLAHSLAAFASGRLPGPAPLVSAADLAVERLFDARRSGPPPAELMQRLLGALVGCDDVRLDGAPVAISLEPVLPIARLEDRGDGFALQLAPDPRHSESFANGVALCGGALRPLGNPHLSLREREELTRGRVYPPEAAPRLVAEVIPELRARIPVEIATARLPREETATPRLRARLALDDHALFARAGLLAMRPMPASALESLVSSVFGEPAEVEPFQPASHRIEPDDQNRLGAANSSLGADFFLGEEVVLVESRFRLRVGPLALGAYDALLPDQAGHAKLVDLLRFATRGELDFEIQLLLAREEAPALQLGAAGAARGRLGWSSWLAPAPGPGPALDDALFMEAAA